MSLKAFVAVCFCVSCASLAASAAAMPAQPPATTQADDGEAARLFDQAIAILNSTGPARDVPSAVALLERAAGAGSIPAMRRLADLLIRGDGIPAALPRAEQMLRQAIAAGDRKGGFEALGDLYRSPSVLRNAMKAIDAYGQAIEAGSASAKRKLAMMLSAGDGLPADPARAVTLLHEAIAAGDRKGGLEALGDFYRGASPVRNPLKAADGYRQAADAGNASAMRKLAAMLAVGDGVDADPAAAETLLQQAVQADAKSGLEGLGDLYRLDTPLRDAAKAVDAYQRAADAGNIGAMKKLAALYAQGGEIPADPARAEALLQQVVAAGDRKGGMEALGDFYRRDPRPDGPAKALEAYRQAAAAGSGGATRKLASMLAAGEGAPADFPQAVALLDQMVAAGDRSGGLEGLGDLYRLETPSKNPPKAADAYGQAAAAGSTGAMLKLAAMLAKGDGIPSNPARAEALFTQAIEAGNARGGAEGLGDLYASFTPLRDIKKAMRAYAQASDAGSTGAMRKLAALFAKGGDGVPANGPEAGALLQRAVAAGDLKAGLEATGDLYLPASPWQDVAKAVDAYRRAAAVGNTSAARKLATLLAGGGAVAADPPGAEALLRQAIALGDVKVGSEALGDFYRLPTPLKNPAAAVDAYQRAFNAGNVGALRKLVTMLANGDGVPADPARAETLARQVIAAGDGKNGFDILGDFYRLYTASKSTANAVNAYQHAADMGNVGSMKKLASILGRGDGVSADLARAEALLEQVKAAGDSSGALEGLGDLYRASTQVGAARKAMDAYQQAADIGNTSAMRKLAQMLTTDKERVKPDPRRAEALLLQAVAAGDGKNAYAALGDLYRANKNGAKAAEAYRQAIAAGNAGAVVRLAEGYLNRQLGKGSSARGIELLKRAVADNVPGAASSLAIAYIYGKGGVRRSPAMAIKVLEQAAADGDVAAARRLILLYTSGKTRGFEKNIAVARKALALMAPFASPDVTAMEALAIAAAEATNLAQRKVVVDQFEAFDGTARGVAASRIFAVNPKTYLFVMQTLLSRRGYYAGGLDGRFNGALADAIRRLCNEESLAECSKGPLSSQAIPAVARVM